RQQYNSLFHRSLLSGGLLSSGNREWGETRGNERAGRPAPLAHRVEGARLKQSLPLWHVFLMAVDAPFWQKPGLASVPLLPEPPPPLTQRLGCPRRAHGASACCCTSASTWIMKASNSSSEWKRATWPETRCSTRPS